MSVADLLLVRLPPAPCRIWAITGDDSRFSLQHASMVHSRWEEMDAPPGSFDRILYQNNRLTLDPCDLFSKAFELLDEGGEILILGEFALRRTRIGCEDRPLLKHFIALAERLGFRLVEVLDSAPGQSPDESLGDRFLCLKKTSPPRWRVSEVTEKHQIAMRTLFQDVFGHAMNERHWYWKYAEGRGQAMGAWRDGELIAHYGGTTREILYFGKPQLSLQVCDAMVKKGDRGTLSKKGPFFLVAATFVEKYLGFGAKHPVLFGFPNERHLKILEKLDFIGTGEVDRIVEVSWTPQTARLGTRIGVDSLRLATKHGERIVNRLWTVMKKDFESGLIGLRDWRYVKHRYLDHPDKQYEIFVIRNRLSRRPRGIAVCHRHDRTCEILDLIGPLRVMRLMVEQIRHLASQSDIARVYCWVTAHHARIFANTGETLADTGILVPANLWTEGPPLEQIRNRWWLMSGDTDFR